MGKTGPRMLILAFRAPGCGDGQNWPQNADFYNFGRLAAEIDKTGTIMPIFSLFGDWPQRRAKLVWALWCWGWKRGGHNAPPPVTVEMVVIYSVWGAIGPSENPGR